MIVYGNYTRERNVCSHWPIYGSKMSMVQREGMKVGRRPPTNQQTKNQKLSKPIIPADCWNEIRALEVDYILV